MNIDAKKLIALVAVFDYSLVYYLEPKSKLNPPASSLDDAIDCLLKPHNKKPEKDAVIELFLLWLIFSDEFLKQLLEEPNKKIIPAKHLALLQSNNDIRALLNNNWEALTGAFKLNYLTCYRIRERLQDPYQAFAESNLKNRNLLISSTLASLYFKRCLIRYIQNKYSKENPNLTKLDELASELICAADFLSQTQVVNTQSLIIMCVGFLGMMSSLLTYCLAFFNAATFFFTATITYVLKSVFTMLNNPELYAYTSGDKRLSHKLITTHGREKKHTEYLKKTLQEIFKIAPSKLLQSWLAYAIRDLITPGYPAVADGALFKNSFQESFVRNDITVTNSGFFHPTTGLPIWPSISTTEECNNDITSLPSYSRPNSEIRATK